MPEHPTDENRKRLIGRFGGIPLSEWANSQERAASEARYDRYIEQKEKLPGPFDPELLRVATPRQAAAAGLLSLMFGISERVWCSGWTMGLEDRLWSFREYQCHIRINDADIGSTGYLTERHRELLRLLSDECDGWWIYIEGRGPRFVSLADWTSGNVSYNPDEAG